MYTQTQLKTQLKHNSTTTQPRLTRNSDTTQTQLNHNSTTTHTQLRHDSNTTQPQLNHDSHATQTRLKHNSIARCCRPTCGPCRLDAALAPSTRCDTIPNEHTNQPHNPSPDPPATTGSAERVTRDTHQRQLDDRRLPATCNPAQRALSAPPPPPLPSPPNADSPLPVPRGHITGPADRTDGIDTTLRSWGWDVTMVDTVNTLLYTYIYICI
jgi:hypothetical protein